MGAIKFDVRSSDPNKAIKGGGDQPPVGMYKGKVVSVVDEQPEGKDRRLHCIYEITHTSEGKKADGYVQLHDYITFAESQDWKMDQFLQAMGVATGTKRTGTFDPDKLKGKKIKIRVKSDSYNGEYQGKAGGVWKDDGKASAGAEDEPDDDEGEAEAETDDQTWAEFGALIDSEEADDSAIDEITAAAEEAGLDMGDYEESSWEELGQAIDDNTANDDSEEEESEGDDEDGGDEEGEAEEGEEEPYDAWSIADLRSECEARELETTGAKSVLVKRLEENDEEAGPFDE